MDNIDDKTVIVYNHTELARALGTDNAINYVYLGSNIIMAGGITVFSNKKTLVIDGLCTRVSTEIRTLSDSGTDRGTIMISTPIEITFQNLDIMGRNYYGVPLVFDNASAPSTTVTYYNVTYVGPQMTWHTNGLTKYIDCDVTIKGTGYSVMHEVAEVRWLEIGGNTIIRHNNGTGFPAFLFRKENSSLTILKNANVEISTDYDFLLRENNYPKFVIQPYAKFMLTTERGISRNSSNYVSSFLVDEYATFRYIRKSDSGATAALYIGGAFTVNKGATVYMQADYTSSRNNRRLVWFNSNLERGLYLNNPKDFALYNKGPGMALYFSDPTPFYFDTGQINLWNKATLIENDAGGFSDVAPNKWNKLDWSNFTIRGNTINTSATAGSTTIEETTLTDDDLKPLVPLENFQLHKAQVFSAGDLPLTVAPIIIEEKRINGSTDPDARIRALYKNKKSECRIECGADIDGSFTMSTEEEGDVQFGENVSVISNMPFLLTTAVLGASYEDELHIEAPEMIVFSINPISLDPVLLPRIDEDPENPIQVTVTDVREIKTPWRIYANITGHLRTEDNDVLTDAVAFVSEEGQLYTLLIGQDTEIHFDEEMREVTPISWDEDKGILAHILSPIRSGKSYTTQIIWGVRPLDDIEEGGD